MNQTLARLVKNLCDDVKNDPARLMDVVTAVQDSLACVSADAIDLIVRRLHIPRVLVESTVTFYSFLSETPKGKVVIRLCNDIVDRMQGMDAVAQAFEQELGIKFGQTTPDGAITLEYTPCIGMSDQAPAALINDTVFTCLSSDKARQIVRELGKYGDPKKLSCRLGDGNNAHELVHSMVHNGLRNKGPVIFSSYEAESGLKNTIAMSPIEVIKEVKIARLRGRGGAGFPTGLKWEFTRAAEGERKFVICNADEGEPGTFKDRVILTERADLLLEGMTIGGYAIGAEEGILYLRAEYKYLKAFLEKMIRDRHDKGLLGKDILGRRGFNFDIRVQIGAGAYVCGEETALISSCEGLRGDPKNRPPFPVQKGYLGYPTSVNNVETFCCVSRIMDKGAAWFSEVGSKGSPSTKLLSVSGDCTRPGVYEFPFGVKVRELLQEVGGDGAVSVLVGGPSGQLIGDGDYDRTICYDDLPTGGAVVIFGPERNILEIVHQYMEFFVDESCGFCTPCRAGNLLLKARLEKILGGFGEASDLQYLQDLGDTIRITSRCGFGQTSAKPVLSSLKNFRPAYEAMLKKTKDKDHTMFNIHDALTDAETITGRASEIYKK